MNINNIHFAMRCLACGSPNLETFFDVGTTALANSYERNPNTTQPRFPLYVNLCNDCTHSQLGCVVDPDLLYRNYLYISSTTQTFRDHCAELARYVHEEIPEGSAVLDIAANDGLLLECFRDLGHLVAGVDPATNLQVITEFKGLHVECDYWSMAVAGRLISRYGKFSAITGCNVFGHSGNPLMFLLDCKEALDTNGIVVLEFPYAPKTFMQNQFDQIYHEHISYWNVTSISALAQRVGLNVIDAHQTSVHGGSIRITLSADRDETSQELMDLRQAESTAGLLPQKLFSENMKRLKRNFLDIWSELDDKTIVGYGASAKSNTAINLFGVKPQWFVDDNPEKWGFYTPTNCQIKPPDSLKNVNNLVIFVTAWNFFDEIRRNVSEILDTESTYLLYVPKPAIVTM